MKKAYFLLYLLYVLIWGWLIEVTGRIIIFEMSSPARELPPLLAVWGKSYNLVYNTSFQLIVIVGILAISGFFVSRRFHGASFVQIVGICFLITHVVGLLLLAIFAAVIQNNYFVIWQPESATVVAVIINFLFLVVLALFAVGLVARQMIAMQKRRSSHSSKN